MTLQDTLDAPMRAQLRSRYRPLPPMMAETLGEEPPTASASINMPATIEKEIAMVLVNAGVRSIECMAETSADPGPRKVPTMKDLIGIVSNISGVSINDFLSPRRARAVARPRQVIMYLAKHHSRFSLPVIGRSLGQRDHTTAMHGISKVGRLLAEGDKYVTDLVSEAEAAIRVRFGEETT